MLMVMVKVDDDHDNDEGGFGIGRVVRISQVYQLRICLGRIPIQPPYHILSFHPTTKTMLLSSPNSASLCPNFSSSSHSSPSTQPTTPSLETVSWFQRCSDFDWKVSKSSQPIVSLPTRCCFHCVIFINHPTQVLEKKHCFVLNNPLT